MADESSMDPQLEKILQQHNQLQQGVSLKILELNPDHKLIKKYDQKELQGAWSMKPSTGTHPFEVVDFLNSIGNSIDELIADIEEEKLLDSMKRVFDKNDQVGLKKVSEHYRKIFSGLFCCSYFNSIN